MSEQGPTFSRYSRRGALSPPNMSWDEEVDPQWLAGKAVPIHDSGIILYASILVWFLRYIAINYM